MFWYTNVFYQYNRSRAVFDLSEVGEEGGGGRGGDVQPQLVDDGLLHW